MTLGKAIARVERALVKLRVALVRAHAARAEYARHGAGQLSLSAQRAPTAAACDDGWRRVEGIVAGAEDSAEAARVLTQKLEGSAFARSAQRASKSAATSAAAARRIVAERNHAYTFHVDSGFSFGEGWYVAAAAVLAGIAIQIEPDQPGTPQAERFLRDAGLSEKLQAYRSRPRANKQVTDLVARGFEADPLEAQRRLRAAFLGESQVPRAIADWADAKLAAAPRGPKVLLWIRRGSHQPGRNTSHAELTELLRRARQVDLVPVLFGETPEEAVDAADLTLIRSHPLFLGDDLRRAQLQLFEHLRTAHDLVGQIGVTTAGMDGPALLGLPTVYLTDASNVRMREWVGAVPGYQEIVRDESYLDRASAIFRRWAR